jgi:hypothetical protein
MKSSWRPFALTLTFELNPLRLGGNKSIENTGGIVSHEENETPHMRTPLSSPSDLGRDGRK